MVSIYRTLGMPELINAEGTITRLGGCVMDPAVVAAMAEAAKSFVDLNQLLAKAGQHVAALLGVEAAYITSGAAAGLTLSTAACITGADPAKIRRLPDLDTIEKNEVLIQKSHRNGYDHAVRQAGVKIVEFGMIKETYPWEMRAAISESTAAVVHFLEFENHRNLPLPEVIAIAQEKEIPVIVDAAAELPPADNLSRYFHMGADLTVFSGGKDIGGPQSSGLIVGRADLIDCCALNANPNYSIGRAMKAGKEEIAGLVTALELYLQQDFAAEEQLWEDMVAYMVTALKDVPGLDARRVSPSEPGVQPNWIPRLYLDWDEKIITLDRDEVRSRLLQADPGIAVGTTATGLFANPQTLVPGQEKIVAQRLHAVLLPATG
ncbi:D-Glucosaminate-6-phosphate ammonia-lyase (EC [Olavius sp. associated proteobacterium Delta 1]|nr:D-Glucosaminate-6-phosphate ammonia-lyase (EC [Olavius sp. associated proteobacterium Delta 1]